MGAGQAPGRILWGCVLPRRGALRPWPVLAAVTVSTGMVGPVPANHEHGAGSDRPGTHMARPGTIWIGI